MKPPPPEDFRPEAITADFFRTYVGIRSLPPSLAPEIAFVGRSNAGKSSLLNALVGRKDLARTSGVPGKTQALNYFTITWRSGAETEEPNMCFFVDLPGYGYAKVAKTLRQQFQAFIDGYLESRQQLVAVVLVCDVRRAPAEEEERIIRSRRDIPIFLALTKADKLSGNERVKALQSWKSLRPRPAEIFFCSAKQRGEYDLGSLRSTIFERCSPQSGTER